MIRATAKASLTNLPTDLSTQILSVTIAIPSYQNRDEGVVSHLDQMYILKHNILPHQRCILHNITIYLVHRFDAMVVNWRRNYLTEFTVLNSHCVAQTRDELSNSP